MSAPQPASAPAVLGYLDAVEGDRVYGWAWNQAAPAERVEVQVVVGDRVLGTARADRPRDDLRAGGIGDGGHAFVITTPEPLVNAAEEVRVEAKVGETVVPLPRRKAQAPEEVVIGGIARLHNAVDRVGQLQQRNLAASQAILNAIERHLGPGLTRSLETQEQRLQAIEAAQGELAKKLEAFDFCIMRLDASLKEASRAGAAAQAPDAPAAPAPWLMTGLLSLAVLLGLLNLIV